MRPLNEFVKITDILKDLEAATPEHGCSIEDVIDRLGREGLLIAVIMLTLPFLLPVSIPGTSIPFGTLIILVCIALMTARPLKLPQRLCSIRIRRQHMVMLTEQALKLFRRLEKWSKPRLTSLTNKRLFVKAHHAGMMANSFCMMLPLPMPLSNAIPAYGIVFLALGLLRRDGFLVIGGYVMLIAILAYLGSIYTLAVFGFKSLFAA